VQVERRGGGRSRSSRVEQAMGLETAVAMLCSCFRLADKWTGRESPGPSGVEWCRPARERGGSKSYRSLSL
jgi:hypothetical protein